MAKQTASLAPITENTKSAALYAEEIAPFRIEIETRKDDCCISFHQLRSVVVDGTPFPGRPEKATVRENVMEQTVLVADPVTKKSTTVSVEGIVVALNALRIKWYAEDRAAEAAAAAAAAAVEALRK